MLDLQEDDRTCPRSRSRVEEPRRAHRGRARAGRRRDEEQRGGLRAADEHGRGVARPLRGAPAPSSTRMEEEGERKHDAMANMVARPQSLQDYLRDQLGWFELDAHCGRCAERIIYNLDANGYLQGRLEDMIDPSAGRSSWPWPRRPWRWCRSSIRPAWRPAICGMPAVAVHAGHALLRAIADAHLAATGGPRAQPAAGHPAAGPVIRSS